LTAVQAGAPEAPEAGGFHVEATGVPRLSAPDPAAAPHIPGEIPQAPVTPELVTPMGRPVSWRAAEAQELVAGAHNVPGALLFARKAPLFEAWHADTSELAAGGPSLARLFDRLGPPGAGGLMGMVADGLTALNSVIAMEVTHVRAVIKASEKLEREELAQQTGQAAPPATSTASNGKHPAPAGQTAQPASPAPGGSSFAFDPELAAFLGSVETPSIDYSE
jgi:hypothetical protein